MDTEYYRYSIRILEKWFYKDSLKARDGEIVFIPPINDYDLINNYDLPIAAAVWVNFLCPVKDEINTKIK